MDVEFLEQAKTYLAGHVKLNGLDADVLGPLRHDVCVLFVWEDVV